jgi:hypothetical protein
LTGQSTLGRLRVAEGTPLSNNQRVQSYTIVVFGAVALFIVIGVLSTFTRGNSVYDQIGRGGLSLEGDGSSEGELIDSGTAPDVHGGGADPQREREIRQLLQARSDRRVSRGEQPLDVDAELARLATPPAGGARADAALTGEVRQLVLARNERRLRQGLEPLDVEDEVRRTLAELGSGS